MARLRTVKPGLFTNDLLAEIDPLGRLLFIGLWCIADREGRLEDRPRRIKAEVLPYDDADVDHLLDDLATRGFIIRYTAGDNRFIQVVNFGKHQSPHVKENASTIPAPDMPDASTMQSTVSAPPVVGSGISSGIGEQPQSPSPDVADVGLHNDASASAPSAPSKPKPTGKQSTSQQGDARGAPNRPPADVAPDTADAPPEPPPAKPAINPLWDALVLVLGFAPKTTPERSNWGKAVKDLKGAGATPDEIRARAARYVKRFGRERLTVNAIVTHWSECGEDIPATKKRPNYAPPEPPTFTDTVEDHNPWKTPTRPAPPSRQTAVAAAALRKDDTHVKF